MGTTRRKLWRDLIIKIRADEGREVPELRDFFGLSREEQLQIMGRKWLEEAIEGMHEIMQDPGANPEARDNLIEEMADFMEIAEFVMFYFSISKEEVLEAKEKKRATYGGFHGGIVADSPPSDKPGSEAYEFEFKRA